MFHSCFCQIIKRICQHDHFRAHYKQIFGFDEQKLAVKNTNRKRRDEKEVETQSEAHQMDEQTIQSRVN